MEGRESFASRLVIIRPFEGLTMKFAHAAAIGIICLGISAAPVRADDIDRISISAGAFDVLDNDDNAVDFRVEYRPGMSLVGGLKPWLGGEVTSDGGVYGALGFLYDLNIGNNWILTPSVGAGLFSSGGGKDLGSTTEFREQIEVGYQFENTSRVSAAIGHMSNWGINDRNPGTEVLSLYYHIPVSWIGGSGASSGY